MMTTIEAGDWLYVTNGPMLKDEYFLAYVWEIKPEALLVEIYGVQFHIPTVGPGSGDWEFTKV